ncbi:MAG: hypothetical protein HYV47_02530 [Candidatus Nealsonbacteria bacterium]|nr:hypothetical protein [Candidatus Nealsonbacteria bacterium]
MPSARVVFVANKSISEELEKVKRFLPVLDYFAAKWGIKIYVDTPHGVGVAPAVLDRERTAYLHFFSFNSNLQERRPLGCVEKLFGFTVPVKDLDFSSEEAVALGPIGNDVGAVFDGIHDALLKSAIIQSSEGRSIAEISLTTRNIYILFDIAHSPWEGEDFLLWQILQGAFPLIFPAQWQAEASARDMLIKNRFHKKVIESADKFILPFHSLSFFHLQNQLKDISRALEENELVCGAKAEELLTVGLQISQIKERLNNPLRHLKKEELEKEFEKILRMEAIWGVEIKDNILTAFTGPLSMERRNGGRYAAPQIGQHRIVIDFHEGSGAVRIGTYGWRGPYEHSAVARVPDHRDGPFKPCWGSVIDNALAKALADFDMPSLIHLALTFLVFDENKPSLCKLYKEGEPPPEKKPFYATDEARDDVRQAYVELARNYREYSALGELNKKLDLLGQQEFYLIDVLREIRQKNQDLLGNRWAAERLIKNCFPDDEFKKLLNDANLIYFSLGRDWIFCSFCSQRGVGKYGGVNMDSVDICLDVNHAYANVFSKNKNLLTGDRSPSLIFTTEEEKIFRRLVGLGRIGSAILAVRDILVGVDKPFEGV